MFSYCVTNTTHSVKLCSKPAVVHVRCSRRARVQLYCTASQAAPHVGKSCHSSPAVRAPREAILSARLCAHDKAITAALVLTDTDGTREIATASMDKTIALWRLEELPLPDSTPCPTGRTQATEVVRLTPPGGPIFSLASDTPKPTLGERQQIFCGNHAKSIVAWEPPSSTLIEKVHLNSHTGWVRALATHGKWLFSSGCNYLRQWDMTRAVPRLLREVKLFTGDILGLCTGGGRVFACTSNGAIKAWEIGKLGELTPAGARDKAHTDRVTSVVWHKHFLYSVSYDGSLKMWDATTLELVVEVKGAHDKQRIQCITVGPDGFLYTGGDDKLVRRWHLGTLAVPEANALYGHHYAVRSLAAGKQDVLVSGDSSGELAIWHV